MVFLYFQKRNLSLSIKSPCADRSSCWSASLHCYPHPVPTSFPEEARPYWLPSSLPVSDVVVFSFPSSAPLRSRLKPVATVDAVQPISSAIFWWGHPASARALIFPQSSFFFGAIPPRFFRGFPWSILLNYAARSSVKSSMTDNHLQDYILWWCRSLFLPSADPVLPSG